MMKFEDLMATFNVLDDDELIDAYKNMERILSRMMQIEDVEALLDNFAAAKQVMFMRGLLKDGEIK